MKKRFFLLIQLLAGISLLFAQENVQIRTNPSVPPAPAVSELAASVAGNEVTLSWTSAPGIDGENIIFRANKPITAANYYTADKRGTIPYTDTTFTDTLEDAQDYYYAVLSRDSRGSLYEIFLPVSNSLLVAVSAESEKIPVEEAVFASFDTIVRNDAVIINWKSSKRDKNVVIYRSTSPFAGMTSLLQAIVVSSFPDTGTPYVDYPVPGVPYYYSILDEDAIRTGTVEFRPGENTNIIPVEIPSTFAKIQRAAIPGLRPMPLPFLNPLQTMYLPLQNFSPQTEKMISSLETISISRDQTIRNPYIFLSDIKSEAGGEEYSLRQILETSFMTRSWEQTIDELNRFLNIRRTSSTTARAHFYLGEAYFFIGDYRKALLEFLMAQDQYFNQSREWIQYVLERMV